MNRIFKVYLPLMHIRASKGREVESFIISTKDTFNGSEIRGLKGNFLGAFLKNVTTDIGMFLPITRTSNFFGMHLFNTCVAGMIYTGIYNHSTSRNTDKALPGSSELGIIRCFRSYLAMRVFRPESY